MSEDRSSPLPRLLLGLAIGATAIIVYNRQTLLGLVRGRGLHGSATRVELPPGGSVTVDVADRDGGTMTQNGATTTIETTRTTSTAVDQGGLGGRIAAIRARVQAYVDSARAQVDTAIAEGQATAAQTRQELEARFNQAKTDPESARTAFK